MLSLSIQGKISTIVKNKFLFVEYGWVLLNGGNPISIMTINQWIDCQGVANPQSFLFSSNPLQTLLNKVEISFNIPNTSIINCLSAMTTKNQEVGQIYTNIGQNNQNLDTYLGNFGIFLQYY